VLFGTVEDIMRSSRATLYLQRLGEFVSQLTELEDLRSLVEDAERDARGAPALRPSRHASRRLRGRDLGALSVRVRRYTPASRNAGGLRIPQNDNQIEWTVLEPFPDGWWASS
jgi:hypothetical protein